VTTGLADLKRTLHLTVTIALIGAAGRDTLLATGIALIATTATVPHDATALASGHTVMTATTATVLPVDTAAPLVTGTDLLGMVTETESTHQSAVTANMAIVTKTMKLLMFLSRSTCLNQRYLISCARTSVLSQLELL
jgi:hypothetical protein